MSDIRPVKEARALLSRLCLGDEVITKGYVERYFPHRAEKNRSKNGTYTHSVVPSRVYPGKLAITLPGTSNLVAIDSSWFYRHVVDILRDGSSLFMPACSEKEDEDE